MILTIIQRKRSIQETKENTCTNAYSKEYYTPPKTSKTKGEGVMDIEGVNAEQGKDNSELTKKMVERISVKTKKLSIRTLKKKNNSKESKFPSKPKFESENNVVDCNMFVKDYSEYNATKKLI